MYKHLPKLNRHVLFYSPSWEAAHRLRNERVVALFGFHTQARPPTGAPRLWVSYTRAMTKRILLLWRNGEKYKGVYPGGHPGVCMGILLIDSLFRAIFQPETFCMIFIRLRIKKPKKKNHHLWSIFVFNYRHVMPDQSKNRMICYINQPFIRFSFG